jgi:histone H2A
MRGNNRLICTSVLLDEAGAGNTAAVKEMLAAGADVHHRDHNGYAGLLSMVPLQTVPWEGLFAVLIIGPSYVVCSLCRNNALYLALKYGHRETRLALMSAGAKLNSYHLDSFDAPKLTNLCAEYGLNRSGAKGDLVARLVPKLCSEADAARYHEEMLAQGDACDRFWFDEGKRILSTNANDGNEMFVDLSASCWTERTGLTFPYGTVHDALRSHHERHGIRNGSAGSPIYLAAVMEYIVAEILELSGDQAESAGRPMITEKDIKAAIQGDSELNEVFCTEKWACTSKPVPKVRLISSSFAQLH